MPRERLAAAASARLMWRGADARLDPDAGGAMFARILAYLFGIGGLLLLATLALPGTDQRQAPEMATIAGSSLLFAVYLIAAYDRLSVRFLRFAPAIATLMVGLAIYFAQPAASAAYAMYLVAVVIAAALFFDPRLIVAHGLFAVGVYAAALGLGGEQGPVALQLLMLGGAVAAVTVVMSGVAVQLREILGRLELAAHTDPLTGLLNRRALAGAFERELARSARGGPMGVVLLDLDGFKRFNDLNGHPAGDAALRRLGGVLLRSIRTVDHVARIGGEEFVVVAPDSDTAGALAMAERLRRAVELEFGGEPSGLTASCGVASSPADGVTRQALIAAADRALYEAKAGGRNKAVASASQSRPHLSLAL